MRPSGFLALVPLTLALLAGPLAASDYAGQVPPALSTPAAEEAVAEAEQHYREGLELNDRWHASQGEPEEARWEILLAKLEAYKQEETALAKAVSLVEARFQELYGAHDGPREAWQEAFGAIHSARGAIQARRENERMFRERVMYLEPGEMRHVFHYLLATLINGNNRSHYDTLDAFGRWADALGDPAPPAGGIGGIGGIAGLEDGCLVP